MYINSTKHTILALILSAFSATFAAAQTIYGITTANQLTSFSAATPAVTTALMPIAGLSAGQDIVGFDTRPRTGELYVLGYNATMMMGRLYKLATNGQLAPVGSADFAINLGASQNIGFDFNPTVDRIRVVATNRKNYRLHPDLGTVVANDADLAYAANDMNAALTPQIGQIAYTNSYISSTKTTLFYLDEANNVFGKAADATNPNNGQITSIGSTGLTFNATDKTIDLDVAFNGTTNIMYLVANTLTTTDMLYTINTATGAATLSGAIGATPLALKDIAVAIDRTVPALMGDLLYGLTTHAAPRLVSFDSQNPSVIRTDFAVTGVKTGQSLVGMDIRPQDNKIYALGAMLNMMDTVTTIYNIEPTTGVATIFADSVRLNLGGTPHVGFDFNPVANRLRIVSAANRANYRLNLTVSPVVVIRDTMLTYKATDVNAGRMAFVGTVAYSNNYTGATATKMYDIDEKARLFLQQNTPNGGFLNTIAPLPLMLDTLDYSVDMDIVTRSSGGAITNTAYFVANTMGGNNFDSLYTINFTGGLMRVGRIGNGIGVREIAGETVMIVSTEESALLRLDAAIFPNPSEGVFQIRANLSQTEQTALLSVFDMTGKRLITEKINTGQGNLDYRLDITNLPAATYFVKINTETGIYTQKIIKF